MKRSISFNVSFEVGDSVLEYLAVCDVDYHVDNSWGEDADGNRGVVQTIIDNVEIVYVLDENGNNLVHYDDRLKAEIKEKAAEQLCS